MTMPGAETFTVLLILLTSLGVIVSVAGLLWGLRRLVIDRFDIRAERLTRKELIGFIIAWFAWLWLPWLGYVIVTVISWVPWSSLLPSFDSADYVSRPLPTKPESPP